MDSSDKNILASVDYYRPRSAGDNVIGSVCLSVRLFVCPSVSALTNEFETKMKRAENSHYQSEVFVCVSTNHVDAVGQLLS